MKRTKGDAYILSKCLNEKRRAELVIQVHRVRRFSNGKKLEPVSGASS